MEDDVPKQCAAILARMEAQNLADPWRAMAIALQHDGLGVPAAHKLAEKLMQGNLLRGEGDRASDEVSWGWVLDNLTRAAAEGEVDLLPKAPSHKAFAILVAARADPKFAQELLLMDLKITRQRMERQNSRRFEDDCTDIKELIGKCTAGIKRAGEAA